FASNRGIRPPRPGPGRRRPRWFPPSGRSSATRMLGPTARKRRRAAWFGPSVGDSKRWVVAAPVRRCNWYDNAAMAPAEAVGGLTAGGRSSSNPIELTSGRIDGGRAHSDPYPGGTAMSLSIAEALEQVELEPGRVYSCQVREHWIELRVLEPGKDPKSIV